MMNQEELKAILLELDPHLKKYFWNGSGEDYTVWTPHHPSTSMSDNLPEDRLIKVTIDRYTKNEGDDLHLRLIDRLEQEYVAMDEPLTVYESDTGYFHHIVECYVVI